MSSLVKTIISFHVIVKCEHYVIIVAGVSVSWLIEYCHTENCGVQY